jgi:hypothetical protein
MNQIHPGHKKFLKVIPHIKNNTDHVNQPEIFQNNLTCTYFIGDLIGSCIIFDFFLSSNIKPIKRTVKANQKLIIIAKKFCNTIIKNKHADDTIKNPNI